MSNVPKLRFKEFGGEWEEKKLGDYGKLINGLTYSPDNIVETGLLVLRSSNIQNEQLSFHDNVYVNLEVKNEYITKENDILICVRNGSKRLIGKSLLIPKDLPNATHGAFMTIFRGSSNKFISHWFKTPMYFKEVHKNLGATINSINGGDLKKFKTIFPSKPEQEKIASFLTSVDTKIEQLTKKEALLQEYKKGVMGKIFNQEIRFKDEDGGDFEDWENVNLSNVCDLINGYAFKTITYNEEGKHIIITIKNVQEGVLDIKNIVKTNIIPNNINNDQKLNKGDILVSMTGNVGRVCLVNINNGLLNQRVGKIKPFNINKNFMFHLINNSDFKNKMIQAGQGGAQENISKKDILEYNCNIPTSKIEQEKIANFLTEIDKKIENTKKEIENTKIFKKALLQEMFV